MKPFGPLGAVRYFLFIVPVILLALLSLYCNYFLSLRNPLVEETTAYSPLQSLVQGVWHILSPEKCRGLIGKSFSFHIITFKKPF